MATVNLGRLKPVWRGTWAASTAYVKDDMVQYGVNTYICTVAHTSTSSFNSSNFNVMATGASIPSQTGNAGKALVTDGTNMSWGDGGQVVATTVVYNSDSAGSGGTRRDLSGEDFGYDDNSLVAGSFTKQQSGTKLFVIGHLSQHMTSGNSHDTFIWIGSNTTGSKTQAFHLGLDNYRMTGNRTNFSFNAVFTGISTGTHYCCMTSGRGDTGNHDLVRNYNPESYISGDTANTNTNSMLIVMEVL